jgi:transcriptional regulator with XRE-family HTH domain
MLSGHFGRSIRKERQARRLSQAGLASAARVSRSVLSGLERGGLRPVQTDVLDRIFAALGVSPYPAPPDALEERRCAREEQRRRLDARRIRHLRLAAELAGGAPGTKARIAEARRRVELWQANRTCSQTYIERWSALLALSPRELGRRMVSLGEWEDALYQNTPWTFAWS